VLFAYRRLLGTNTLTVQFDGAANAIDLRLVEYSGLSPTSALDAVAANAGQNGGDISSGTVTITANREVIVGAGMTTDQFSASGAGFNERAITSLHDLLEDRFVFAAGQYAADAVIGQSAEFVMQVATFR
jgi:hypothetical protein